MLKILQMMMIIMWVIEILSGGLRGGLGGLLEPPIRQNYFNFMGKFVKNQVNYLKQTPS